MAIPSDPLKTHRFFAQAFNAGDADALVAMYDPAAVLVPGPGAEAVGHDAIRAALGQFLALRGTMHMETTFALRSGDTALTRSKWRLDGTDPAGKPVVMEGNSLEVLRRQADGTWLIVIDHPFGAS